MLLDLFLENKIILKNNVIIMFGAIFANLPKITDNLTSIMADVISVVQGISAFIALIVGVMTIIKLYKDINKK